MMNWPFFIRKLLHDLVNPLSGSKIQLELMQMGASTAEDTFPEIESQLDRMQVLIEKTRDLISIEVQAEKKPLEASAIENIQTHLNTEFPMLSDDFPWSKFVGTLLSEEHFKSVLVALYENAADQQATKILCQPSTDGSFIISDNGMPFTDNTIKEALIAFCSSKPQGIGLGLTQAAYTMELYQGDLVLRATETDKRAELILKLPR